MSSLTAQAVRREHVPALNLPRRRVVIDENAVRVKGRIIVGTPKSHHARSVSMPFFLQHEIAAACAGKSGDALVFGDGRRGQRLVARIRSSSNQVWPPSFEASPIHVKESSAIRTNDHRKCGSSSTLRSTMSSP
jgi:hypothetical protein